MIKLNMIKLKLSEIAELASALSKLVNVQLSNCINFNEMWELTEFCSDINKKSSFLNTEKDKLIVKFGKEKDDGTGRFEVLTTNIQPFFLELEKLMNLEFEFDFKKIKIKDMEKIYEEVNKSNNKLTMIDFASLKKIINKDFTKNKNKKSE